MARGISHNADQIIRRMLQRPQRVRQGLADVAREFAPRLNAEAKRIMTSEIYSVEIPFKKRVPEQVKQKYRGTSRQKVGGQNIRQWSRSGQLLKAETARADGMVITMSNAQAYAVSRNNLGTAQGRPIRTPGVQSVQWQADAIKKLFPALREARRNAVIRALG